MNGLNKILTRRMEQMKNEKKLKSGKLVPPKDGPPGFMHPMGDDKYKEARKGVLMQLAGRTQNKQEDN